MAVKTDKGRVAEIVATVLKSAVEILKSIPLLIWPMPIVLSAVIWAISKSPIGWITDKPIQEIAAPVVIGMAAGLVIAVYRWESNKFTLLLGCFVWSLFSRELHFWGTNNGFYIALLVLIVWGWLSRNQIGDFLESTTIRYLLSGVFLIYFTSKVVDRGYLEFLPEFKFWRHNVEETLETCGHMLVFSLVVLTYRIATLQHGRKSE